jgi:NTE family protein
MVYKPVNIAGREYVDGGLRGTASLDIAIEHGATLVVCVNPLVPYDNSPGPNAEYAAFSRRGFSAIASQVSRILTHSGLRYQIKQLRRQHPEVDIILIEPKANDQMLAFGNIMRYAERLTIARHGFEAVTLFLAEDYLQYKEILARHGIPLSRRLVIEELAEIQRSGYDPRVIERVLEARKPRCNEKQPQFSFCRYPRRWRASNWRSSRAQLAAAAARFRRQLSG